jgi:hypothetical protein
MKFFSGGSFSSVASIQACAQDTSSHGCGSCLANAGGLPFRTSSCWACCEPGKCVRCNLASEELGKGVATADPTSMSQDWMEESCVGKPQLPSVGHRPLQTCDGSQKHQQQTSAVANLLKHGWVADEGCRHAECRVELVHVAEGRKNRIVLVSPLAAVQGRLSFIP